MYYIQYILQILHHKYRQCCNMGLDSYKINEDTLPYRRGLVFCLLKETLDTLTIIQVIYSDRYVTTLKYINYLLS